MKDLWLKSRGYDLAFFQLSGLAALLLLIPYVAIGSAVIFPIYNVYLVFFGLPHNYLTWATIFPGQSRQTFQMDRVYLALAVCAVLCFLIPITTSGSDFNNWILSFISYYSLWHAYRQHHGICKVYDSVQARRTGDTSIFEDRKALNLFFGFAANGVVVWVFTHGRFDYFLSLDQKYEMVHPQIPWHVFQMYLGATILMGVWGLKRAVYDRARAGKFIPWPQLILMTVALCTYIVPYFFIPLEAMPLAVAIGTIFHNVQYFGFVWLFEHHRSSEMLKIEKEIALPQRLALQGSWKKYFGIALAYSFAVVLVYMVTPQFFGLTFIYFLGISHYIIDGYIWRRDQNQLLSPVIARLAQTSAQGSAHERTHHFARRTSWTAPQPARDHGPSAPLS